MAITQDIDMGVEVGESGNITVGTTATRILKRNKDRKWAILTINGSTQVFIGLSNKVTTSTGFPMNQYDVLELKAEFDKDGKKHVYEGEIWGIVASGSSDVRVIDTP